MAVVKHYHTVARTARQSRAELVSVVLHMVLFCASILTLPAQRESQYETEGLLSGKPKVCRSLSFTHQHWVIRILFV